MSNEVDVLVRKIKYQKGLTTEQVAAAIGYTRVHLTNEMKKGKANNAILSKLNKEFADILQNANNPKLVSTTHDAAFSQFHSEIIRLKAENAAITHHMVKCFEKLGLGAAAVQMAELEAVAGQLQKLEIAKAGK